jgi:hypothetical protein
MSGYNKVMSLYDPDSDEDSSDGGSMILASGIGRRDSGSDTFSIDSALMESYIDQRLDEQAGLKASAYNPSALRIRMGTAVNIDGDSDDDGKDFGNDPNYAPLTVGHNPKMSGGGDMDEHSIGSDDEFQPAVHSNFPKHNRDITNEMSAHDGNYRGDGQDDVDLIDFSEVDLIDFSGSKPPPSSQPKGDKGGKGGKEDKQDEGYKGDKEEEKKKKVQRAPQSEVKEALARVKQARGKPADKPEEKPEEKPAMKGVRKIKDMGKVQREKMSDKKAERRAELEKKGLPVFTGRAERRAKMEAEAVRQTKDIEYKGKKEDENKIPNTKFSYTDIKVAGKTQKQINHDTYGLLDGKVDKLPNIEKALAEAEEIKDPSDKVKALIKKLKALKTSTQTKKRKVEGVAKKYVKRKKEAKEEKAPEDTGAGTGLVNVGGNVHKLNV